MQPTYETFDAQLKATLESLRRWNEAEREVAQARLDMARDVRAQIKDATQ
jgi:hypothetical protein